MSEKRFLTELARIQCGHGGLVQPQSKNPAWHILGQPVLTVNALRFAPIIGCGLAGSGGPFCSRITEIVEGISSTILAGTPAVLESLDFLTDGPYAKPLVNIQGMAIAFEEAHQPLTLPSRSRSLPARIQLVLHRIFTKSGSTSAVVTSLQRTPREQARIMYENLAGNGVAPSRRLYRASGQKVIDVYEKNKALPKDKVVKKMEKKIREVGPSNVSAHCREDGYVVDVAPSSIQDRNAFEEAVKTDPQVSKFLTPPNDPAYHIELK
jgi:hypothetical protein